MVLAPLFTEYTGINVEFETTSWDQMYSKAINDMEANTGIYDFVYIEQDIIYSYLAQDYLVNLTQYAADNPDLAFADYDESRLHQLRRLLQERRWRSLRCADGSLSSRSTCIARISSRMPISRPLLRLTTAIRWRRPRTLTNIVITPNSSQLTARAWIWIFGARRCKASTGHPASTYEFLESIGPSFGLYNWGIDLDAGSAQSANGGALDGDTAVEALTFWLSMLPFAPPEATSSTWDEVASTFAAGPRRAGLGLR